jgi:SagB-type dehydrogenase family enzyme
LAEFDIDAAELFHLNSSHVRATPAQMPPDQEHKPSMRRLHPGARRIALGGADLDVPLPLGAALAARRSARDFAETILPADLFGKLLFTCAGVNGTLAFEGVGLGARTYPSGGALYPLEIYPVLQRVEGIGDGVYHYDPFAHELEEIRTGNFHEQFAAMTFAQEMLATANAVLFITALFERSMWKYGQRGYRYVWIEAGHLGQNFYLVSAALGLASLALGGFYDTEANALLGVSGGEKTIYAICIGQPRI